MSAMDLLLIAGVLMMAGGFPAGFGPRRSRALQYGAVASLVLGSGIGLAGLGFALASPEPCALSVPWGLPWGRFSVGLDALSAVFLIPVFTIPALGSVYGLAYWRQTDHPDSGRGLSLSYGLMAGAMVFVVIARDAVLLLMAWEIMAVTAFFLITADRDQPEAQRSGWIYLVATHIGTCCLLALFALLRHLSGSFDLSALDAGLLSKNMTTALFVLTVVGFGFKAGLFPLHVWLPGAHANAPSHVSAVLSGVMLKMGIYGILRVFSLMPEPPLWNGQWLIGLGVVTGLFGISLAIAQSDIKRVLAFSSIENIGIILLGIGLAMTGRTLHRADLILLGLGGALLHVWNHSLFKPLLFLNSGAIIHAAHTRDMNRMGGLASAMPWTAGLFLLGSLALCGLPPLNGFVSEWLIYLGLFRHVISGTGPSLPASGIGAVALSLIGALALACFVRLFGTVFLGQPRTAIHETARDPSRWMRGPMLASAAGCVALGLFPQIGAPLIRKACALWQIPGMPDSIRPLAFAPGVGIGIAALTVLSLAAIFGLIRKARPSRPGAAPGTWGCGYAAPTARMQYTGASFGAMLETLLAWALRPRRRRPVLTDLFPSPAGFSTQTPDPVLDRAVLPGFQWARKQMMKLRLIQQGRLNVYLLYILVTLLFLLFWMSRGTPS